MRLTLCTALLTICAANAPAQTAQKVIDEYLQAAGGSKALAQIHTETLAGSLTEESTGKTGSWSLITQAPNRFYLETIAGSDRVTEAYNGKSAWAQNSPDIARTLTGDPAKESEASARYWNTRLTDLGKSHLAVQLTGTEQIAGREQYHLHVQASPGVSREVFLDLRTHLITRETWPTGQIDYSDYRPIEGIQLPTHLEFHLRDHNYKIVITRAEINAPVSDSVFDFPATPGTPLPNIADLIREVSRNQDAIDKLRKEYTCHLTEEAHVPGAKGSEAIKIQEYEVFNVGGEEVRRLTAKDGTPLNPEEQKKEDKRFNKQFEDATKEAARRAADPKKQAKQDADDEAQISDFLRVERFTNPRRERFRGEDVIAVDFGPNPDYKPKKSSDKDLQKLTGMILIDDKARDVARLEAHLDDSVKVAGGVLASLSSGSGFVFEQSRINDEIWMPSYGEIHFALRALLLVKLQGNLVFRYTDYKKFRADSKLVATQE